MAIDEFYNSGPGFIPSWWELIFSSTDPEANIGADTARFRVRSITMPNSYSLEHESNPVGVKYYSGTTHVDEITVEIEERDDFSTRAALETELNRVYDIQTRRFRVLSGEDELPDAELTLFRVVGGELTPAMSWLISNMRILSIGEISLNRDTAEVMTYTVTFAVDDIQPQIPSNQTSVVAFSQ